MKKEKSTKEAKEHKKPWQETHATTEEIQQFLSERVMLRYNVVTHQTEVHMLTDFGDDLSKPPEWIRINDRIENTLWKDMSKMKEVRMQDMRYVIGSDFVPEYHPFRFYLKHLPPWNEDKGDSIMGLSLSVNVKGDAEEQMLFYDCLKKWLVAMVASWVDDTVVNNVMLVLIGEQGAYKTTWFSYLLPPELRKYFYTKTNSGLVSKDDLLTLAQYGLMCWEELDSMQLKELNKLKAAMTMPTINERAPFERHPENRPHIASFCGTGNNVQFLSDPTGTRRWLPFEVESIESPRSTPFDYEGIYSQAYALYRQGFRYWFSPEEIRQLAKHNKHFQTARPEQELVDEFFRKPVGDEKGIYLSAAVALQMTGAQNNKEVSATKLGRAFSSMGYEFRMLDGIRRYHVIRRSTADTQQHRQLQDSPSDGSGEVW